MMAARKAESEYESDENPYANAKMRSATVEDSRVVVILSCRRGVR